MDRWDLQPARNGLVQFDESTGQKFGPRVRERTGAGGGGGRIAVPLPEELVQAGLEGLETFLEQEQHEHRKR